MFTGYPGHGALAGSSAGGPATPIPGTVPNGGGNGTPHGTGPGVLSTMNPSTTAVNSAGLSMFAPGPPIPNTFGMGGMGGMGPMGPIGPNGGPHVSQAMVNPSAAAVAAVGPSAVAGNGFNHQYMDPSLARKRSVTFAEVHHMRSQSMSSVTTQSSTATTAQFGAMPMLMNGGADTFGQASGHHPSSMTGVQAQQYPFQQQPSSQPPSQQQQQQQGSQQQQQGPQQPGSQPPSQVHFHHGSQMFNSANSYPHSSFVGQHMVSGVYHPGSGSSGGSASGSGSGNSGGNGIRRTNSLSHIQTTAISEQRLAAGRPRSGRDMDDDSDEDSDDDYDYHHPVMGGMSSRPGSALSVHNSLGGNGETSLTLEFSDMASVSGGHGGHHHHQQHDQGNSNSSTSASSAHAHSGSTSSSTSSTSNAQPPPPPPKSHHRSTSSTSSLAGASGGAAAADAKRKRKRREMQPVKETIYTDHDPYVDQYLWKNNGNTTQKKTGCKSIYYKCSNSANGCTVNKTVTEREGGGYVTKYRGVHLDDCARLKKAQIAAQAAQAAAQNGHHSMQKEP
ncbi:hypothetical protein BGX31_007877 [Mortierella sp. GBA43]|nr:hypothetical protein BGX31_007877 [Mortierella sp. GBA43]